MLLPQLCDGRSFALCSTQLHPATGVVARGGRRRTMVLLEREAYLGELGGLLREAAGGNGRVAFVGGEAGVGKSALVRAFGGEVGRTARVLTGACDPATTPRPLGPLADIAVLAGGEV